MRYLNHLYHWPVIRRNQWRRPDELAAMQVRALRRLIAHAYAKVPYYHDLFKSSGIVPGQIAALDDLRDLPILTKDIILANYPDGIIASDVDWTECSARMTSGSSGKKLDVVLDHSVAELYRLMQLRQLIDVGYKPWDKIAYVRFSPPVTSIMLQKVNLFRRFFIPLEWEPAQQAAEIFRIRPQVVNAYPSVLYLLAKSIGKDDGALLGLKFLLSNSELLTAHVREYLEDVFQCKVYDDYSCLEFSAIAFECRMQNLHVAADNVIVEVLDDDGCRVPPGVPGRIVVTSLNNYSMPYIRYEIGDVGALSDKACPCGRSFPTLESIVGRCDDFLVMPSGELIDPQTVVFQIETIPEVKEFRVVQQEDQSLVVSIVPERTVEFRKIREEIGVKLDVLFNSTLRVEVIETRALDRGPTGKHRSIVSRTSHQGRARPGS